MVLSLPSRQRHANKFCLFLVVLLSWYKVFGQNCKPKDCIDLRCYRVSTAHGGARIYPESISFTKIQVTCKQTGDGGGWIVFMRRFDGSLSFKRTWDNYKSGFGEQGENQELWLGNENLYQLVKSFESEGARLRIEAYSSNGTNCVTTLTHAKFTDELNNYVFTFNTGASTHKGVVDDWLYTRYSYFATFDRTQGYDTCFSNYSGGWWYGLCHHVYFTGQYPKNNHKWSGDFYIRHFPAPLKAVDMLFRPMNHIRACNNPCNNGGTCEYIEATNNHRCVCPETHCGAKCEKVNPCKTGETCVYSAETTKISCVGQDGYRDGPKPQSMKNAAVIGIACLFVVLAGGAIATAMILFNKRQHAQEKERLARRNEERERLLESETASQDRGLGYLFF